MGRSLSVVKQLNRAMLVCWNSLPTERSVSATLSAHVCRETMQLKMRIRSSFSTRLPRRSDLRWRLTIVQTCGNSNWIWFSPVLSPRWPVLLRVHRTIRPLSIIKNQLLAHTKRVKYVHTIRVFLPLAVDRHCQEATPETYVSLKPKEAIVH